MYRYRYTVFGSILVFLLVGFLGHPCCIQAPGDAHFTQVCWDLADVRRAGGVFGLRGRLERKH